MLSQTASASLSSSFYSAEYHSEGLPRPRWKKKDYIKYVRDNPMSKLVSKLQTSLLQSEIHAFLLGCNVFLEADKEQTILLKCAHFGERIVTAEQEKDRFKLGLEEAFYLFHHLKCIQIVAGKDKFSMSAEEVWDYMKSKRKTFPYSYKAYSHLRLKNWVVCPGLHYGVDFVIYRHHPTFIHSDYATLVLSQDDDENDRLKAWSDLHCTVRLSSSVAKTLLILYVNKNGNDVQSLSSLEEYSIAERTVKRWKAEKWREGPKSELNNQ